MAALRCRKEVRVSLTWLQAMVLGVSQGLTEFLPISSSAHTLLISRIMGWGDPGAAFTAVTQVGTEAAVIWYFRHDIAGIVSTWAASLVRRELRSDPRARMGWYVIIGTLPIGVLGVAFKQQIETSARNLRVVGVALIVGGLVLGYMDHVTRHTRTQDAITPRNALALGMGQALALIPGVSRSGATITVGLALGLTREVAARYSFLLAIPAVLASAALEAADIGADAAANWPATIVATIVAAGVGYAVIARLMSWLRTGSFAPFVAYRVVLGVSVMLMVGSGFIAA